ncbi:hypothetical protein [Peribacillus sp. FSL E2-0218]|uniref:hypothetical protein n=1 Tax=Peribacillus sp. FSL E2-0218 TaxID=2921364 RepID=UPI0030EE1690
MLREEVLAIGHAVETIHLPDVTPFEWDTVYDFTPYTPKEEINETVVYKWENINETVNECMNQIVFLKDGKVVSFYTAFLKIMDMGYLLRLRICLILRMI